MGPSGRDERAWLIDSRDPRPGRAIVLAGLVAVAAACSTPASEVPASEVPAVPAAPAVPSGPFPSVPVAPGQPIIDRPLSLDDRSKSRRIETSGGISVLTVVPLQCLTAGGRPFARWLATADVVDERLGSAGVDDGGRHEAARLAVDWAHGERLLLVYAGAQPNPGHRLVIDSIRRLETRRLRVDGRLIAPAPGSIQLQVIANPCQLIHLADPGADGASDIELTLAR